MITTHAVSISVAILLNLVASAADHHVSVEGSDDHPGTRNEPFRTIQHAAEQALPGDTITVHAGIYRERVDPLHGGSSDQERIVFQAARGEEVVIKGSEVIEGWYPAGQDTWKSIIPNEFFGDHNPYRTKIAGDFNEVTSQTRLTPHLKAHSTDLAGLRQTPGGDNRFFNNLLLNGRNISDYDKFEHMRIADNHFGKGGVELIKKDGKVYLEFEARSELRDEVQRSLVTSETLGKGIITGLPFVHPDGSPYRLDRDYFDHKRKSNPAAGPFKSSSKTRIKVWPKD